MKTSKLSNTGMAFIGSGILVLLYNWWKSDHQSAIDINLHSTYFVISYPHVRILFCVILFAIGFLYQVFHSFGNPLNNRLALIHFILSAIGSALILRIRLRSKPIQGFDEHGNPVRWESGMDSVSNAIAFGILIFSVGLIIFIVNIITSLIKKKKLNV